LYQDALQFNLKNLSPQLIAEYLGSVLKKEQVDSEEEALWQIASAASGSMRDALTLVDQAISYCEGSVVANGVIEMLGVPPQRQVYALLKAMASRSVTTILDLIREIAEQTPDYGHTLDSLLSALHRIAIAQIESKAIDNSFGDMPQILELASLLSAEDVQLYYQMGLKGREDLRLSAEVRTAFEMLLIRMMVFSPDYLEPTNIKELPSSDNPDVVVESRSGIEKKKNRLESESSTVPKSFTSEHAIEPQRDKAEQELTEDAKPATVEIAEETGQVPESREKALSLDTEGWLSIYPRLSINGIAANVLANSDLIKMGSENAYFVLDQSQSAVYSDDLLPKISQALSDYFDTTISAHFEIGKTQNETPALLSQRLKRERHTEMVNSFEQDENVQELLKHFSGTLEKESIAPNKDQ